MRAAGGRWPFAAAVVLPLAAVAVAVATQRHLDMLPCPWCVLQRAIFVAMALAALPGLLMGARPVRATSAAAVLLLALCGIAAALWQHFVAASSTSCNLTLADRVVRGLGLDAAWPEGFTPLASCADAAVRLLGVPYEFHSLALFTVLGVLATAVLSRKL